MNRFNWRIITLDKKSSDRAYSGSIVSEGETNALVTSTGENTYFGKTAQLVEEAKTVSFLQKTVIKIGDYLIIFGNDNGIPYLHFFIFYVTKVFLTLYSFIGS